MKYLSAVIAFVLSASLVAAPGASAEPPPAKDKKPAAAQPRKATSVAPIKGAAVSSHGPYEAGDCSLCHQGKDPKNPGPVAGPINKVCYSCHEDMQELMGKAKVKHRIADEACTNCHNPHNSASRKLLYADLPNMCLDCHAGVKTAMGASVKHEAMSSGRGCMNCHNPHASNVEHMLTRLPFDQCVGCHDKDGVVDAAGKPLTNYKKLLDENPVHHAPVAGKDCSSCHQPHGSENFRLLVAPYPAQFYSPFDPAKYALCFTCHDDKMVTAAETTTATRFRDGARNLHYVHVNNPSRGRTCRACHEVHASKQPFQVRDGVPFGPKGWILKVNFKANPDGGTCDKTCHTVKSYVNTVKK
ncbi:MAG: cytochrome c3 family protein [Deltaproteobacteria bacterium]|nr:cytochrome c3 family protein [Deltaproteobacteria bacterium]